MLLGELNERDQLLIKLKYFEGLKYNEISERTGMSVGNVGVFTTMALGNVALLWVATHKYRRADPPAR